jgi:hypothetical protein
MLMISIVLPSCFADRVMAIANELLPLAVGPTMAITGCSDVMMNGRAAMAFLVKQSSAINDDGAALQVR